MTIQNLPGSEHSSGETLQPADSKSSRGEVAAIIGGASFLALMICVRVLIEHEAAQDREAQAAIARAAATAYAEQSHNELTLTAQPQSLPAGDLSGSGIIRDWDSGVKMGLDTEQEYRNGISADEAAREVVIDPRKCVWELVGAKANTDQPVKVLAWTSAIDGSVIGEIIDVSTSQDGVLDPETGVRVFDAARFCNYGAVTASVVMRTDRGGIDEYNVTTGFTQ